MMQVQVPEISSTSSMFENSGVGNNPTCHQNNAFDVGSGNRATGSDAHRNFFLLGNNSKTSFPANGNNYEVGNLSPAKTSNHMKSRSFLQVAPTAACRVKSMQEMTHILSLVFFLPGLALLAATPFMVIPIFVFPTGNKSLFVTLMLVEWCVSIMLITFGTVIKNLHWHYDPQAQRLRCTMCCNPKQKFRFWGNSSISYQPLDDVMFKA